MYIEQLRDMFSPPSYNTLVVCKHIILLIPYYISFRLVTFLKIIGFLIQISDIFYFSVTFRFIILSFQIFLLFVREMSASFTSYIV